MEGSPAMEARERLRCPFHLLWIDLRRHTVAVCWWRMRLLVAWDGSELSTLALRCTIRVLSRPGDQLLVYHVRNPGRYGASEEFELEKLQSQLAEELQDAGELHILSQPSSSGEMDEVPLKLIFNACDLDDVSTLSGQELQMALAGVGSPLQPTADLNHSENFDGFCQLLKEVTFDPMIDAYDAPFALRGMKLHQLEEICYACCGKDEWLMARVEAASSRCTKEDLYSLNQFLVRPTTAPGDVDLSLPEALKPLPSRKPLGRSCCFAQLMNAWPGIQCDYFVSHSWSHPFPGSVGTLKRFATSHRDEDTTFWICLFALNQHKLSEELGSCDVTKMPFAYGLAKASFGVLMILDQRVEPFRRIWCLYEAQYLWQRQQPLQLLLDQSNAESPKGVFADKILIWHQVLNRSVRRAFPFETFQAQFEEERCRIHGFGPSWFSDFDSKVSRLLATPVFHFCLEEGQGDLALRYLGFGAKASHEELQSCETLLKMSLTEAWVSNPACGSCRLLHVAAHVGDSETLDFLLANRADPAQRARDQKQRGALHFAVKAGQELCAKHLLEAKALAHDPDKNGETPLQIAAYGGFTSLVQLLLQHSANVNASDHDNWTPLICAARVGHADVVELLLQNKASAHARDALGRTASRHAKLAGYDLPQLEQCTAEQGIEEESEEDVNGAVDSHSQMLMTVHQKEKEEEVKISRMILNFAAASNADVLVMGSFGRKEERSNCFQQTTLGSSAHLAALEAPCSVVLIRPGCRVDPKLATVFMVAVDGSLHSQHALQMCSEWARPDKDVLLSVVSEICGYGLLFSCFEVFGRV
eukprot:symbB.v1.2.022527.t1/scaffold1944.1/size145740/4